jgi:murein DD-endopeptidase MepM/ murein hydrolase activator NlpD
LASLDLSAAKEQATLNKVRAGDTIYSLLKTQGFSEDHRRSCFQTPILPTDFVLAPGDLYKVSKIAGRTELRFFDRTKDLSYLFWRDAKAAGAAKTPQKYTRKIATAEGEINGSIIESINRKVGDELVAYRFMDAYILDYKLQKEVRRGAKFKLTYEKVYDGAQFIRYGEVLRTELEIDGRNVVREFVSLKNGGIFFDPRVSRDNRPFYAPVDLVRISSLFQAHRFHPIRRMRRAHEGIDFEIGEGANIYAAQAGTVIRMGRNHAAGKFIVIRHANGYETYYNHMSSHYANINPGDFVKNGQLIGFIGCTGHCTKPHLHFAVRRGGRFIDPIFLIRGYAYNQRDQISRMFAQVEKR